MLTTRAGDGRLFPPLPTRLAERRKHRTIRKRLACAVKSSLRPAVASVSQIIRWKVANRLREVDNYIAALNRAATGPSVTSMNTVNATERKLQDVLDVSYRDKNPLRTLWVLFHGRRPQLLLVAVLYCIKSSPMSVLPIVSEPRLAEAKILDP
jgi:hypothetical protein